MHRMSVLILMAIPLFSAAQDGVTRLRWAGPAGTHPGTYEEWLAGHPFTDTEFHYTLDRVVHGDGRTGAVAILTEYNLAPYLANEIEELSDNLQDEGYTVYVYQTAGGTPEALREFLQDLYYSDSIEGALFVGNLPVAWFEVYDFGGALANFPIDLFYMDLDGTWLDTINTGNGKYDGHTGPIKPEIYIGRLTTTGIGIDTVLLKNYFRKDRDYRDGSLNLPRSALVFVDDDWIPWAWQWAADVSLLFADTTFFWQPETTRASFYRQQLDTAQTWISVFAHSWPGGHQFSFNNGNQYDYYLSTEYTSQNPPASFYNFFACSFSRYTDNGYGGGRAIFNENYGLGAIGSTKTGSMLDFNYFYEPLGQGRTLGQAFKYWFDCIYDSVGMNFDRLCWHYGMTLLGDPFLKPLGHTTHISENEYETNAIHGIEISVNNPVSEHARLILNLDRAQETRIALYDCLGRHVTELFSGTLDPGSHPLSFDMVNTRGMPLPAGIYMLRATIAGHIAIRKLVKVN
ncbi:hypothetical protein IBX73_05350 [candidate division WOR-3 bacterium]|nr:hypothetical protein [candidate division WOR-3 bacterium]